MYYRFRHLIGQPSYGQMRANLRMNRMAAQGVTEKQIHDAVRIASIVAGYGVALGVRA